MSSRNERLGPSNASLWSCVSLAHHGGRKQNTGPTGKMQHKENLYDIRNGKVVKFSNNLIFLTNAINTDIALFSNQGWLYVNETDQRHQRSDGVDKDHSGVCLLQAWSPGPPRRSRLNPWRVGPKLTNCHYTRKKETNQLIHKLPNNIKIWTSEWIVLYLIKNWLCLYITYLGKIDYMLACIWWFYEFDKNAKLPRCASQHVIRAYFKEFQVVGHIGGEKVEALLAPRGWSLRRKFFRVFRI